MLLQAKVYKMAFATRTKNHFADIKQNRGRQRERGRNVQYTKHRIHQIIYRKVFLLNGQQKMHRQKLRIDSKWVKF